MRELENERREMRIMRRWGDFVADLAMGDWGVNTADYQWCNGYPSFIVRLSFVIGSFKVGER